MMVRTILQIYIYDWTSHRSIYNALCSNKPRRRALQMYSKDFTLIKISLMPGRVNSWELFCFDIPKRGLDHAMKPVPIPPPHIHRREPDCSQCEGTSFNLFPQYSQYDLKMPPISLNKFMHHNLEQGTHCRGSAYLSKGSRAPEQVAFPHAQSDSTIAYCSSLS